jgi:hypothetical protein
LRAVGLCEVTIVHVHGHVHVHVDLGTVARLAWSRPRTDTATYVNVNVPVNVNEGALASSQTSKRLRSLLSLLSPQSIGAGSALADRPQCSTTAGAATDQLIASLMALIGRARTDLLAGLAL